MKKKKPQTPAKRAAALARLIRAPLTPEEHRLLSNPPAVSLVRLKDGVAEMNDLWTVWFRMKSTALILEQFRKNDGAALEALLPILQSWEHHFLDLKRRNAPGFTVSPALLLDVESALELADEVQHETNREYQLVAYTAARKYCIDHATAAQSERGSAPHQPAPDYAK